MEIDWDKWQTLLAVYREGTFAGAAHSLTINATTVGRRLKALERHLDHALFLRADGRLHPTARCEALLGHIEAASESLRAAEQQLAGVTSGAIWRHVTITAPPFITGRLLAPTVDRLIRARRIRIELLGTGSSISLSRREADIAIRIEDRPGDFKHEPAHVDAERIGTLTFAAYCGVHADADRLGWAGLVEQHVRTSGTEMMSALAGADGFQFRAYHFDTLMEIVASGAARALLPCFLANDDKRLRRCGDDSLKQPLWMLSHCQDREVAHLAAARDWIRSQSQEKLAIA